jgi:serine/threonine-protein kinase
MSRLFPHPQDDYPVVYLKDTDLELPEHVRNSGLRYTQFKTVARGGKCLIQSCKDYHLSRIVAYKSLPDEIADDPIEQARFLREARVTAILQHPNTIPIYELSRDNRGHFFFTMKLVEGYTLREVLDTSSDEGTLPVDGYGFHRMVTILIQVANALDYAHSHRVVHRDVKPANILMGPFGEVLLLDWGLAKVWNEDSENIPDREAIAILEERAKNPFDVDTDPSLTSRGRLQGTALYMSPEQIAESASLDHRSDLYSLGVVLYEILAGRHMIEGDKVSDVLKHATSTRPPQPSEIAAGREIPEELENICMRCIEKDPDRRIQTARQLVSALRSWRLRWTSQPH